MSCFWRGSKSRKIKSPRSFSFILVVTWNGVTLVWTGAYSRRRLFESTMTSESLFSKFFSTKSALLRYPQMYVFIHFFHFLRKYISDPVLSYFYLRKGLESVLLLLKESGFFLLTYCIHTSWRGGVEASRRHPLTCAEKLGNKSDLLKVATNGE